jgi:hypothetical protein
MYKDKKIYTITGIRFKLVSRLYDSNILTRTMGFSTRWDASAKADIMQNCMDMSDGGYYSYVVVEEYIEGIYPMAKEIQWYRFENDAYVECARPDDKFKETGWEHVINFGLG